MDNQNNEQQPGTINALTHRDNQVADTPAEQEKVLESKVFVMTKAGEEFKTSIICYDGTNISIQTESNIVFSTPLSSVTKFKKDFGIPMLYIWVNQQLYRVGFSGEFKDSDPRSSSKSKLINFITFIVIFIVAFVTRFALLIPLAFTILWFYNLQKKSTSKQDGSADINQWISLFKENSIQQGGIFGGYFRKPWFIILMILLFAGFIAGSFILTILLTDRGML